MEKSVLDGLCGRYKIRNLRNLPWASIVVIEGEPPNRHRAVVAEGQVILHMDSELKQILDELSPVLKKKMAAIKTGRKCSLNSILKDSSPTTPKRKQ